MANVVQFMALQPHNFLNTSKPEFCPNNPDLEVPLRKHRYIVQAVQRAVVFLLICLEPMTMPLLFLVREAF